MNSTETRRPTIPQPESSEDASVGAYHPHPTKIQPKPIPVASGGEPKQPRPADYSRLSREYLKAELQAATRCAAQEQAEATHVPEARSVPPNQRDRDF